MGPQPTAVRRPKQLVIADDIRMRIESGELPPGASIPTLQELCDQWSVSASSARAAVSLLREQGLVSGGRGKPLMVRVQPRRTVRSSERHQIEKDLVRAPEAERAMVGTSDMPVARSS